MVSRAQQIGLRLLTSSCLILLGLNGQMVSADEYFNQGVRLFNQRNYRAAAPYFETSLHNSPWDDNAYYYAALTYHYMGDYNKAKLWYRQAVERFPGTQAANLATSALKRLDPNFGKTIAGSSRTEEASAGADTQSSDLAMLPNEDRIYYSPLLRADGSAGNGFIVDAEVNNRSVKMLFDTGAEVCAFGKNQLQQLGISPPSGAPQTMVSGVGSSKGIPAWLTPVNLKVGKIKRQNFQIYVQETLDGQPLLGQTFFKDFKYTIDPGSKTIHFVKRQGSPAGQAGSYATRDSNSVPFRLEGKEIIVSVEVNGRSCSMIFDTGASGGICLTQAAMKQVGLSVPEDADEGSSWGVGGQTRTQNFTVGRVKMGPIEHSDFPVSLPEHQIGDRPLLGQEFYKGWQYTIDYDNKAIKFLRR